MVTNGYCQITINGELVGIKFGLPCMKMMAEKPDAIENGIFNALLLYYGYKNNCLVKETIPILTLEAFADYLELSISDPVVETELSSALNCYKDSVFIKALMVKGAEVIDESKKKKQIGTK